MDKLQWGLITADEVITPEITQFSASDFGKSSLLIEQGYQAGIKAVPDIRSRLDKLYYEDSLFVSAVKLTDPVPDGRIVSAFQMAGMITQGALRQIAVRLYQELNLFSISLNVIPSDSMNAGNPRSVILVANVIPRPQFDSLKIKITGNTVLDDSALIAILKAGGNSISSEDIVRFSDSLKDLYNQKGYDLAHLRGFKLFPEEKLAMIDIDEAIVERIDVIGNRRTKSWLIRSNLPLEIGKPFESQSASRGISNIYATGLFDRVIVDLARGKTGAIVQIKVEEKKYTQVRLGWHWDDEYHSEEFAELLDDNLFGTGQEFLMHARYSPRRQKYELSLKADRFFSTYLTYRARTYYHLLDRKIYDVSGNDTGSIREDRRGIEFLLGQQISRFGMVSGEIKWEEIRSHRKPSGVNDRLRLRALTLRSDVETINRYSFPTEGKKHYFYIVFSSDILGGQAKFTKVFSSIESYFPLSSCLNFHPKISVGWTDAKYGVPMSEKFYLGGEYSFSGYRTDELVNDKMVLANFDLRYRLPYRFYVTGRYDAGEVYSAVEQIKLGKLRHGYGFSLAYDSPIGPIDIGYGKAEHHPERYYVNIGLAF